jgi:aminoglycoside phosphotransferase (APT) family kinase protein
MNYIELIGQYLGVIVASDDCQLISHWWDYDVVIYDDMIYRFPKWSKIKNLALEKKILDIIRPYVSLQIPNFTLVDDHFVVYPCIQWQILNDCDVVYTDEFVQTLAWFIKQLHSIPVNKFDFLLLQNKSSTELKQWADLLKNDVSIRLEWRVSQEVIDRVCIYIDELYLEFESPVKCFVHSDLQWDNIIYDQKNQKIVWIIDFADSRIWAAELDFCRFAYKQDNLLNRLVIAYFWYLDHWFIERTKFLAKKTIISQIRNDKIYNNNFASILNQLEKYGFM